MNTGHGNRRTNMTKKLLKDSLVELMKEKPIHSISIKEICDLAQVNRSTFYRHYETQYKLYDEIISGVFSDMMRIAEKFDSALDTRADIMTEMLSYVDNNRELCRTLLSENGSINIGETFSQLVRKVIENNRPNDGEGSELEIYVIQFISAGMANIIWTWLNTEDRLAPSELAKIINTLVVHGIKRVMRIV